MSLMLVSRGFAFFKCEKPTTIGVSVPHFKKVMQLADSEEDVVTLKGEDT